MKLFLTGSHAIVKGAIDAGVRFYAGYPITPASLIYSLMMENLQRAGGVAVGASDEISAISYCIGASMRGIKSMTATSGPGFSLMCESIGYAIMTEIPVVVVLAQRMGPATGAATQSAQGDILFSFYGTSSSFPVPVISPPSVLDCYSATVRAVNISEELRTPVILLTEKETVLTHEAVNSEEFPQIARIERKIHNKNKNYKTYFFDKTEEVPLFSPVGGDFPVRFTGSAHDKQGLLKKDDPEVIEVITHLRDKIIKNEEKITWVKEDFNEHSNFLIISYGITSRAVKDAVIFLRKKGMKISHLIIYSLFPPPLKYLEKILGEYKKIFVPEENIQGQYLSVLRSYFPHKEWIGINKIGSMISPLDIIEKIECK